MNEARLSSLITPQLASATNMPQPLPTLSQTSRLTAARIRKLLFGGCEFTYGLLTTSKDLCKMPVQTLSQKRPADEAPEIDDSVNNKRVREMPVPATKHSSPRPRPLPGWGLFGIYTIFYAYSTRTQGETPDTPSTSKTNDHLRSPAFSFADGPSYSYETDLDSLD